MNAIRQIQALNKRELENAIPPEASWHADYRDTAYIYIGGLPFDLSEGDIVTIFSQYGEPVHVNLVRDKETGKSRGFAFLKYEDQRSTDLAVDNLGGSTVLGRVLRVDHVRYKRRDDEEEGDNVAKLMGDAVAKSAGDGDTDDERRRRRKRRTGEDEQGRRPLLKEEKELEELMINHDEEDPMKEYLIQEKKEEVARALEKLSREKPSRRRESSRERSSRHHRHRHHRRRYDEDRSRSRERSTRHRRSRSREERSYRNRSPPRKERTYRDRTPVGSRSPQPQRNRDREDRHR
ncbi:putative RNA recognition motif containing protein [Aspergillus nomiae NRRL 13137]|uniref:Putative RNA recognition motif containing protein n=1 Tax=Aspergillus nomiae NRRL (strain ATCC 15546 / NRRL 13137 / CBS 260.88 / M93) TaxID=1509407 RepID=A0A0L1J998_ASPN3|nr:putative RNA recognition motif containing protein [Aspergillus nomiae NRRL 13137]KNG87973.1 putative RNA recognition motif containing protein [Aspergillus nomiae NRRL 13137]